MLRQTRPAILVLASCLPVAAQPYNYPFPYITPAPVSRTLTWNGPGGTSVNFTTPPVGDIRNGELQIVTLGFTPRNPTYNATLYAGAGENQAGVIARMIDTYTLTSPTLAINYTYPEAAFQWSSIGPRTEPVTFIQNRRFDLNAGEAFSPFGPRFDVFHPDDYQPKYLGPVSGTLSVKSVSQPALGHVENFSENVPVDISVDGFFRPWNLNEVLAQRAKPQFIAQGVVKVDVKPRFEFSVTDGTKDLAHLGQYDHFNWYQEIIGYKTGVVGGASGTPLTSAQMKAYTDATSHDKHSGRGFGPDPLPGGNPGEIHGDASPLYFDETLYPGRLGFYWANHAEGTRFVDAPNLLTPGDQVRFMTALAGVRADGSFDLLYKTDIPNKDDFVFRWAYTQTTPSSGVGIIIANTDPALGGGGETTLLGTGPGDAHFRYLLPGDANDDQKVDFADLVILARHYNTTTPGDFDVGDFNFDGHIDFTDLVALAQHYNTTLAPTPTPATAIPGAPADFQSDLATAFATVPEPGPIAPIAAGITAALAARRRRNHDPI